MTDTETLGQGKTETRGCTAVAVTNPYTSLDGWFRYCCPDSLATTSHCSELRKVMATRRKDQSQRQTAFKRVWSLRLNVDIGSVRHVEVRWDSSDFTLYIKEIGRAHV